MFKKFMSLVCFICVTGVITATLNVATHATDNFHSLASSLVRENWENNYVEAIIIDIEANTIKIDDNEPEQLSEPILIENSVEKDITENDILIPILPILQVQGIKANFNYEADSIILNEDENSSLKLPEQQFPNQDISALNYSNGNSNTYDEQQPISIQYVKDGIVIERYKDYTISKNKGLLTSGQLESMLNYEVIVNDGKVIITKPYQTKRIVLQSKIGSISNNFGAKQQITDGNGLFVLQFETEEATKLAYESLLKDSALEYVTLDKINKVTATLYDRWGAVRIESDRYKQFLLENGKNENVTVAVLDTGVDSEHEFLANRMLSNGYDFAYDDSTPNDIFGHGTHVSGIVVDSTPENVKILPIKVLDDDGYGTDLIIKLGIDYAVEQGADVINMSLRSFCIDDNCLKTQGVQNAVENGTSVVVAAGNDSIDTSIICPAKIRECITVSATHQFDKLANFSNYGESVDVAAPGTVILSSIPNNKYGYYDGTSMASPFVAASVAMLKMNNPALTPSELEAQIKSTAADVGIKGFDVLYGQGIVDFGIALGDEITYATSISVDTEEVFLSFGSQFIETHELNINIFPDIATNKSFTVTATNEGIVMFNGKTIFPVKEGETILTLSLENGKSASCKVVVKQLDFWADYAAESYAGGIGTQADPFLIETAEQLAKVYIDVNSRDSYLNKAYFKQTADINLSGKIWLPISLRESGWITRTDINYDGDGYKIINLTSEHKNNTYRYHNGFLGYFGGIAKNIHLVDAKISGSFAVGGIAGSSNGIIYNCSVSGTIEGYEAVGGIAGILEEVNGYELIVNCYSNAQVTGGNYIGGIAGVASGTILNSYFNGSTASSYMNVGVGNIAGIINGSKNNDMDFLTFHGTTYYGKITNCFSASSGALVGEKGIESGIIQNSYFLEGSKAINFDINPDTTYAQAKPLSFFKDKSNYLDNKNWSNEVVWDFDKTWEINGDSLPTLKRPTQTQLGNTDFEYEDIATGILIKKYIGKSKDVVIPEQINGRPVKFLGERVGAVSDDIESLFIPDTVTHISWFSFYGCENLSNVNTLQNIKVIGRGVFAACTNLTEINIAENNRFYTSQDGVVFSKDETKLVLYPVGNTTTKYTVPDGVIACVPYSFEGSHNLESITFPSSTKYVVDIGHSRPTNLKSLYFMGDSPEFFGFISKHPDFTIYYIEGKPFWTKPIWNGYKTETFVPGEEQPEPEELPIEFEDMKFKQKVIENLKRKHPLYFQNYTIESDIFPKDVRSLTELDVSSSSYYSEEEKIESLKGIEYFTNLIWLDCSYNNLTQLDVSNLKKLISLNCNGNNLKELILEGLTNLEYINCGDNDLSRLDVSNLRNLLQLNCSSNSLTELNVSNLTNLSGLHCSNNNLVELDVTKLTKLNFLDCSSNSLEQLDVSNLTNLSRLHCSNNNLIELDVTKLTKLEFLACGHNNLEQLDVSNLTNLFGFYCYSNNLTELNVTKLTKLNFLDCSDNSLEQLGASNLTNLLGLSCYNNNLTELDVTKLTKLEFLNCGNNNLNQLDVSNLTNLSELHCHNNNLTELNVANLTALVFLECGRNNLTELNISNLISLRIFDFTENKLVSLKLSDEIVENVEWFGIGQNYLNIEEGTELSRQINTIPEYKKSVEPQYTPSFSIIELPAKTTYKPAEDIDLTGGKFKVEGEAGEVTIDMANKGVTFILDKEASKVLVKYFDIAVGEFKVSIEETGVLLGDVNSDGNLDTVDLIILLRYNADWNIIFTPEQQKAADVYQDGVINVKDLVRLTRILAGFIA